MTIADLVVTVLFKFRPEALEQFLDLKRPAVKFLRERKSYLDFCISRVEDLVEVYSFWSSSENTARTKDTRIGYLNQAVVGGWDEVHIYRIDDRSTSITCGSNSQTRRIELTEPEDILGVARSCVFAVANLGPWEV